MSDINTSNPSNLPKQSEEISTNNIGNLLSYGSLNLTLTLELFEEDFSKNNIEWKNFKNLSNLTFIKENQFLWERIKLSSTEETMQILLHMNKVLRKKIKIKHICFRKMKFKNKQQEFKDFLKTITNLNGLYLESHSLCRCEISVQLRLRYNGKRRLFVLCGERTPLEDDEDEDDALNEKEDDNVLLEEGHNYNECQEENDDNNEYEEEKFDIEEKKNDEEYNPFIDLPKEINNFNDFYFIYFNYYDYTGGIFSGNITINHLYKYFIYLQKNSKVRIVLNMMKEDSENSEEIRDLLSVSSITIFYDKNILFQLLNRLRYEEEKIRKEQEHFRHYYEKKLKDQEIENYLLNEERKGKIIQNIKENNNTESPQLVDDEKSFFSFNNTYNRTFYSIKNSISKKKYKNKKEEEKMIVIKKNKYFPPLTKVDMFNYYKKGICDKDPLKSKEEKIIIVLDEFYKVFIVQFNRDLDKPFSLDFDLKLYPQINVHNIEEIQDYKRFIKDNFERYIIIFIGYLLSSLALGGGSGEKDAEETSLFIGYYGACKVLKNIILFEKNEMILPPNDDNFFYPNLNKNEVEALIQHAEQKKKEYKFILDCNNKNVIKLKLYNPLLDKFVFSYLNKNRNKNLLKNKGFINNKGKLLYDPVYRESTSINKREKIVKDEKELYKTCHDFKTKNNFKMKENECLDRYKNKNEKLNKFVIGFRQKRPEYEIYLHNVNSNRLPPILQKRICKTSSNFCVERKKASSFSQKKGINLNIKTK